MIKDSAKELFEIVLVWKLDRFSRDRYDSAHYKHILKKNGVKVVSVKENISDGPEGIILESMLEGYAEYYSAELSQKIRRGQKENALKCKNNGGGIPLGYIVGPDGILAADPLTAPLVKEIFTRYDAGESISAITASLNEHGLKTSKGKAFKIGGVSLMLKNRKYIGEYRYGGIIIPKGIPAIIDEDLFERVQQRMALNKKAPAKGKAAEIGAFLDKYIPAVEQMHTTLKKYNTAFTATIAENKKLKKKAEQLAQSLDKATQESTLKKLADAKLHRDYEDAVAVLDRIPKEVLAAYTHRTEKERETAYGR